MVNEKLAQNTVDHNRMSEDIHAPRNDFNGLPQEMNTNFIAINSKLFEGASG